MIADHHIPGAVVKGADKIRRRLNALVSDRVSGVLEFEKDEFDIGLRILDKQGPQGLERRPPLNCLSGTFFRHFPFLLAQRICKSRCPTNRFLKNVP
ncbi:MAG: hypothetical protein ACK44W_16765, partial [Planctomycetota bacterium]